MKKTFLILLLLLMLVCSACTTDSWDYEKSTEDKESESETPTNVLSEDSLESTNDVPSSSEEYASTPIETNAPDYLLTFEEALEFGKVADALSLYNDFRPEDMTKANNILRQKISDIKSKYYNDILDYYTATTLLNTYTKFSSISTEANSLLQNIDADEAYHQNLKNTLEYFESKKYESAILESQKIPSDSRFYQEANELFNNAAKEFRNSVSEQIFNLLANEQYKEANDILQSASLILSSDEEMTKIRTSYREAFIKKVLEISADLSKDGKYADAVSYIKNADMLGYSEELQTKLDEYRKADIEQKIMKVLTDASTEANLKNWDNALKILEDARISFPNSSEIENQISEYKKSKYNQILNDARITAQELANNQKWLEAIEYLEDAVNSVPKAYRISFADEVDEYANAFLNAKLSEAEKKAKQKDWEGAIACLEKAKEAGLSSSELDAQIEQYQAKLPKSLTNVQVLTPGISFTSGIKDQFNNSYNIGYSYYGWTPDSSTYYLNKQYTTFTATIWNPTEKGYGTLNIYCDDVLVYSVNDMTIFTAPRNIEIDIKNCRILKIEIDFYEVFGSAHSYCIANPMLLNK